MQETDSGERKACLRTTLHEGMGESWKGYY